MVEVEKVELVERLIDEFRESTTQQFNNSTAIIANKVTKLCDYLLLCVYVVKEGLPHRKKYSTAHRFSFS